MAKKAKPKPNLVARQSITIGIHNGAGYFKTYIDMGETDVVKVAKEFKKVSDYIRMLEKDSLLEIKLG